MAREHSQTGFESMIYEKIKSRRTIRKYLQKDVPQEVLLRCVDAARLSPSGANRQPLKYMIVNDQALVKEVFGTLSWARYLPDYRPSDLEMPRAYIVMVLDRSISETAGHDAGIAAMSISMVASDVGLGSCILGSVNREKLKLALKVPDGLDIVLVIALGYPAENPVADEVKDGNVKYWLDENRVLHVPKRSLEEIARWNGY